MNASRSTRRTPVDSPRKIQQRPFAQVHTDVLVDPTISPHLKAFYALLMAFSYQDCFTVKGQEALAAAMGVDVRTIRRWTRALEALDLIETNRRGNGKTNVTRTPHIGEDLRNRTPMSAPNRTRMSGPIDTNNRGNNRVTARPSTPLMLRLVTARLDGPEEHSAPTEAIKEMRCDSQQKSRSSTSFARPPTSWRTCSTGTDPAGTSFRSRTPEAATGSSSRSSNTTTWARKTRH